MKKKQKKLNLHIKNKQNYYNYEIFNEIEAGIVLKGWEVKSIKSYKISIKNSYVLIKNQEAYAYGLNISSMKNVNTNFSKLNKSKKKYKLLLKRSEINNLINKVKKFKFVIIIQSIYLKKSWIKLKIAIAKRIKKYNKKEKLKMKELKKNKLLKTIDL